MSELGQARRFALDGLFRPRILLRLTLLRQLAPIDLAVLLLVLLTGLLILLGSLAGLRGICGLVWLGGSNVDCGHRISFVF